jgi:hypothetical protein
MYMLVRYWRDLALGAARALRQRGTDVAEFVTRWKRPVWEGLLSAVGFVARWPVALSRRPALAWVYADAESLALRHALMERLRRTSPKSGGVRSAVEEYPGLVERYLADTRLSSSAAMTTWAGTLFLTGLGALLLVRALAYNFHDLELALIVVELAFIAGVWLSWAARRLGHLRASDTAYTIWIGYIVAALLSTGAAAELQPRIRTAGTLVAADALWMVAVALTLATCCLVAAYFYDRTPAAGLRRKILKEDYGQYLAIRLLDSLLEPSTKFRVRRGERALVDALDHIRDDYLRVDRVHSFEFSRALRVKLWQIARELEECGVKKALGSPDADEEYRKRIVETAAFAWAHQFDRIPRWSEAPSMWDVRKAFVPPVLGLAISFGITGFAVLLVNLTPGSRAGLWENVTQAALPVVVLSCVGTLIAIHGAVTKALSK